MAENNVNERLLDSENWKYEAEAVIKDVKNHVNQIEISKSLENTDFHIYLNVITKENKEYCVEMSSLGFRIVGEQHDVTNLTNDTYYETPYSLLNTISPLFHDSFGNELMEKLNVEAKKSTQ